MSGLDVARKFATALDAEDYAAARGMLAEACVYDSPGGVLVGPEAIVGSYRAAGESARGRFEAIEYSSAVVEESDVESSRAEEQKNTRGVEQQRSTSDGTSTRKPGAPVPATFPHPNPLLATASLRPEGEGTEEPSPGPGPSPGPEPSPGHEPSPGPSLKGRGDIEAVVEFVDRISNRGRAHEYRCRQALRVDAAGLIVEIRHIELPGEREGLEEFVRSC